MQRVDLKIGFKCNNRCEFCVQGDKRARYNPKPLDEIEEKLKEGRARGAQGVVLTGGEPTVHRTFLDTVRLAKDLGYETIQIQTNGRMFCYMDFCQKTIEAGATEFSPALHGSTAELHGFLTGNKDSFLQTVAGIKNLKSLGQYVLTNTVITKPNYRDLPDLAKLLVALDVDQFQLAFVHVAGSADKNREWLVPRKALVEPWVKSALSIGLRAGKIVMTEAIPYCRMKGFETCVAESIIPETTVFDAEGTIDSYTQTRLDDGKARREECEKCIYFKHCEGPWREYPDIYSWEEFEPILHGTPVLRSQNTQAPASIEMCQVVELDDTELIELPPSEKPVAPAVHASVLADLPQENSSPSEAVWEEDEESGGSGEAVAAGGGSDHE